VRRQIFAGCACDRNFLHLSLFVFWIVRVGERRDQQIERTSKKETKQDPSVSVCLSVCLLKERKRKGKEKDDTVCLIEKKCPPVQSGRNLPSQVVLSNEAQFPSVVKPSTLVKTARSIHACMGACSSLSATPSLHRLSRVLFGVTGLQSEGTILLLLFLLGDFFSFSCGFFFLDLFSRDSSFVFALAAFGAFFLVPPLLFCALSVSPAF